MERGGGGEGFIPFSRKSLNHFIFHHEYYAKPAVSVSLETFLCAFHHISLGYKADIKIIHLRKLLKAAEFGFYLPRQLISGMNSGYFKCGRFVIAEISKS